MATKRNQGAGKDEGMMEAILSVAAVLIFIFAFTWFMASHKIVYYTTPLLRWLGLPWLFAAEGKWAAINEAYVFFRNTPGQVPLSNYLAYANACLLPLAIIISVGSVIYLLLRVTAKDKSGDLRRRLAPMKAATEIARIFPSILPVLHLGPELVADKLPLWRRQTFPEDVWTKERIGGRPLASGSKLFPDRVDTYFRGGELKDSKHQMRNGRRWSKMLGYQAVDLLADAEKQLNICFPDRFSPQGKVLFGVLCAHAFGGREGKLDYVKACDELNRTSTGQKNGLPNLQAAQWIYTKYRLHADAKMLFTVHHWEFTYLFALFMKAKRNGKATHTDFIWLKPLDRIMFYALNTVGRAVPPVEAAAVFAQYDYEHKCALYGRLPLRMRPDGTMEANICIHTANEGLATEFKRYLTATDDTDDWWKNLSTWSAAKKMSMQQQSMKAEMDASAAVQKMISTLPVEPDTTYDLAMSARAKAAQAAEDLRNAKNMAGATGGPDMF